jgi:plasmid maintenance system antidote protein VapI
MQGDNKMDEEKFIKNRIATLLKQRERQGFKFKPGREFFQKIGIKQKRWGILVRNDQAATTEELMKIAKYFGFCIIELIEL